MKYIKTEKKNYLVQGLLTQKSYKATNQTRQGNKN